MTYGISCVDKLSCGVAGRDGGVRHAFTEGFDAGRTHFFITTDIGEAIFLADRLLIMSNSPLQVCQIIEVDIPRPRKLVDVIKNDRANDMKIKALTILHAEAIKSFAAGHRAAADLVEAYSRRYSKSATG